MRHRRVHSRRIAEGFRYNVNNIRVTSTLPAVELERNEVSDDLSCWLRMTGRKRGGGERKERRNIDLFL